MRSPLRMACSMRDTARSASRISRGSGRPVKSGEKKTLAAAGSWKPRFTSPRAAGGCNPSSRCNRSTAASSLGGSVQRARRRIEICGRFISGKSVLRVIPGNRPFVLLFLLFEVQARVDFGENVGQSVMPVGSQFEDIGVARVVERKLYYGGESLVSL